MLDVQAKQTALRMIPYGVFLLTVKQGDQLNASTVSWLSQVSFTPPLVMVAIKKDTLTHAMVEASGHFAINVLAEGQTDMAQAFFKAAEHQDGRLSGYAFESAPVSGAPLFLDTPAWFECRVTDVLKRGDHSVVVAEVVAAGVRDAKAVAMLLRNTRWQYGG